MTLLSYFDLVNNVLKSGDEIFKPVLKKLFTLEIMNPIIIMDDYGNSASDNVRKSIDDKVKEGKLKIHKMIGEDVGFKTKSGWEMNDREGVICNYEEI